jgi:hypothetical protein
MTLRGFGHASLALPIYTRVLIVPIQIHAHMPACAPFLAYSYKILPKNGSLPKTRSYTAASALPSLFQLLCLDMHILNARLSFYLHFVHFV